MTKIITTKWFAREPLSAENFESSSLGGLKKDIISYYSDDIDAGFMSIVEIWSETRSELSSDEVKEINEELKIQINNAKQKYE